MNDLDEILRRVWQNGYQINRWEDLKEELRQYFKAEAIEKELK